MPDARWGREVDRNLFTREADRNKFGEKGCDAHSIVGDPMFVDPANGDFRVKPGSPALALGFANFPMDRFGVQQPALKAMARTPQLPVVEMAVQVDVTEAAPVKWMGATLRELAGEEFSAFGVTKADGGMHVIESPGDSPANAMGLRPGDLVQSVNGLPVPTAKAFRRVVRGLSSGQTVRLDIVRDQGRISLEAGED